MKCILAFEQGLADCNRPEDRVLVEKYLTSLVPLLADALQGADVRDRIQRMDRLFGNTWIIDDGPFRKAFDSWAQVKLQADKTR